MFLYGFLAPGISFIQQTDPRSGVIKRILWTEDNFVQGFMNKKLFGLLGKRYFRHGKGRRLIPVLIG